VVSSFTIIKGAMIEESMLALRSWDLSLDKPTNLKHIRERNDVGARSAAWLRDVVFVISRRFDPSDKDLALVTLAKGHCPMDVWTPILLWHVTRDEFLFRDFLLHGLFPVHESGAIRVSTSDVLHYLSTFTGRGGTVEHAWSPKTTSRVAAGLLKMAADFGLLVGRTAKQFASYHLPEASFLYLLHAMSKDLPNPGRLIASPDWRMYFMAPDDVERRILDLHQFHRLEYHAAGSLAQLTLPCRSAREFAERMVA
jgi:hypothetical protein